jgi:type II restriction enzyme
MEFTLADMYRFERRLNGMHRRNRNVRPKIRQQLQVLRDRGLLDFVGKGKYRLVARPTVWTQMDSRSLHDDSMAR